MIDFDKLETEALQKYKADKYKAVCEYIADFELQVKFLQSEEGSAISKELSGELNVADALKRAEDALRLKKVELKWLQNNLK